MPSALESFLSLDCDRTVAGWLRTEIPLGIRDGLYSDTFEFNTFDVEVVYAEDQVTITEAAALGTEPTELSIEAFLKAIPEAPSTGPRMPGYPRRVIVPAPPSD